MLRPSVCSPPWFIGAAWVLACSVLSVQQSFESSHCTSHMADASCLQEEVSYEDDGSFVQTKLVQNIAGAAHRVLRAQRAGGWKKAGQEVDETSKQNHTANSTKRHNVTEVDSMTPNPVLNKSAVVVLSSVAGVHQGIEEPVVTPPPDIADEKAEKEKEEERHHKHDREYGFWSLQVLVRWWWHSIPWGKGPTSMKVLFCSIAVVQLVGPMLGYWMVQSWFFNLASTRFTKDVVESVRNPCKGLCVLSCTWLCIFLLMASTSRKNLLLQSAKWVVEAVIVWCMALLPLRFLRHCDRVLEQIAMERVTNDDFLERRDFMNAIKFGSNIVGPSETKDDQGNILFKYLWRPFYLATVVTVFLFAVFCSSGSVFRGMPLVLSIGYLATSMLLATFGARTMGPQIYGGVLLFLERPFKEGDIVTLDARSGSGAQTNVASSVVTGFVERIGICTTTIRRFDMRCVWVPNNLFAENPIANWNSRPRKLILLEFGISNRTPPKISSLFQEKVLFIVKNHDKIDQSMYTKCAINSLKHGIGLQIVCFNVTGTRKKEVQQDLILRIAGLARRMGVTIISKDQQSLAVECSTFGDGKYYLEEPSDAIIESAGLDEVLPQKKAKLWNEDSRWFAPKGQLILRVERVLLALGGRAFGFSEASGPSESDCESVRESDEVAAREKKRPYKVFVHMAEPKVMTLSTHVAHCSYDDDDGDGYLDLRFFENLSFPLEGSSLPCELTLDLVRLRRGLTSWALQHEVRIATAKCDVSWTVAHCDHPISLELLNPEGKLMGSVHVNVFIPEGFLEKATREPRTLYMPTETFKFNDAVGDTP